MKKNEVTYSLWLRPTQDQIDAFTNIISDLSHRYRTKAFPPHITLLAGLTTNLDTLKQVCNKIVDQVHEFGIPLQKIDYTEAYFRNFYLLAENTSDLLNLYKKAVENLTHENNEKYMPHVSLLYGKLDSKTKQVLKEQLTSVYLKTFNCQRLDIYNTTGDILNWHLVKSYYFNVAKK